MNPIRIINADVIEGLRQLEDQSVNCVVTSPPYWGLRDYKIPPSVWGGDPECVHEWTPSTHYNGGAQPGEKVRWQHTGAGKFGHPKITTGFCTLCSAWLGCFGLEPTPELYVEHIVTVFREVWRVLRDDGTLWINLGDCYATDGKWGGSTGGKHVTALHGEPIGRTKQSTGLKPKDLVGMPWRVAFALQADGWYLRRDIIWSKKNPMPESCKDRPTTAHEYIFLLSKKPKYYFDADAVKVPAPPDSHARYASGRDNKEVSWPKGWDSSNSNGGHENFHRLGREGVNSRMHLDHDPQHSSARKVRQPGVNPQNESFSGAVKDLVDSRNIRSVWEIATQPYPEAHFATFPEDLVKPCILAGCPVDGVVLDPFAGSGTMGKVALEFGRRAVLIELSPEYCKLIEKRLSGVTYGLPLDSSTSETFGT